MLWPLLARAAGSSVRASRSPSTAFDKQATNLAFLFWPDSDEAQARTNLRKQLYHLRRDLPDADRYLHIDNNVVHWRSDQPFTLDVDQYEQALARAGDGEAQLAALQQATALYGGDLLPNCYDDWVLAERRRLRRAFSGALLALASLLEDRRDYEAAAGQVRYLLRLDPLHEPGYRQLMRLQVLQGNRAGAIKTYQTCVDRLEAELGVAPSAATAEVYQRLMQQRGLMREALGIILWESACISPLFSLRLVSSRSGNTQSYRQRVRVQ